MLRARAIAGLGSALAAGLLLGAPAALAEATLPPGTQAQEAIVDYAVAVDVQPNADMVITERITYNPGTMRVRHGLIRDIPTQDVLDGGRVRVYGVDLLSVSRDGGQVPYTADESDGTLSLRIGDENTPITGLHEFQIAYRVRDGLDVLQAGDLDANAPAQVQPGDIELYWDFVGDQWDFPVYRAEVAIKGPARARAATCYAESVYDQGCQVDLNGGPSGATTMMATSADPPSYAGTVTGVIAWDGGAFTQLPTPFISDNPQVAEGKRASALFRLSGPLALLALALPIALAIVFRRRSRGVVIAATPVRYEPPEGLRPAELLAGLEGNAGTRGVAATLADVAARGHITVRQEEPRAFHREGLELTSTEHGKDALQFWEESLLSAIFQGQPTATIGSYDPALAAGVSDFTRTLKSQAKASGRYNPTGDKPDRPYKLVMVAGMLCLAGMVVALIASGDVFPMAALAVLGPISIGLIIGGIAGATITPRRQTPRSAAFIAEAEGFRRFMDSDSAAARRDFAQRTGMTDIAVFATFLPYAIALGLEDTWIDAFPDLDPAQLSGFGVQVTTWGALRGFTSAMTTSVASGSTTRSSGSGFSGGGGAGGGGGGGGGGSF